MLKHSSNRSKGQVSHSLTGLLWVRVCQWIDVKNHLNSQHLDASLWAILAAWIAIKWDLLGSLKKKENAAWESAQESESLIEFHTSYTFTRHKKFPLHLVFDWIQSFRAQMWICVLAHANVREKLCPWAGSAPSNTIPRGQGQSQVFVSIETSVVWQEKHKISIFLVVKIWPICNPEEYIYISYWSCREKCTFRTLENGELAKQTKS